MTELCIVGNSEFTAGFELIGIKKIFVGEDADELKIAFTTALKDADVGIIVTNNIALDQLHQIFRRRVESSVTPVVVSLSTDSGSQQNLRDLIKKAIGIDLLKD